MLHRLFAISPYCNLSDLLYFPTYCNIRPISADYFVLFKGKVRFRQFLGRAPIKQALGTWGPGAVATSSTTSHIKPRIADLE